MEIEMKESKEFEPVQVPDNVYVAEVADIKELELEYGATVAIGFKISEGDHKDKVISGLASKKITERTKLGTWIQALGFTIEVGKKFQMTDLMGRKCRILAKAKPMTYNEKPIHQSRVTEVLPIDEVEKIN